MRLVGVNIPDEKKVGIALTYIFGVGPKSAGIILEKSKIDFSKRTKDLTPQEVAKIKDLLEKDYQIEGELRASVRQNVNRLKNINYNLNGARAVLNHIRDYRNRR